MFKCAILGKQSKQGDPRTGELYHLDEAAVDEDIHAPEKPTKIVIATRKKEYFKRVQNEETRMWEDVFVASGTEIVKEINVCQEGLDMWNSWTEGQQLSWSKNAFPHLFLIYTPPTH